MEALMTLAADPAVWAALITLIVMEVVLGIDNLVFISILSNKLPEHQRQKARRIGISLALIMRLVLLSTLAFIVGLTAPVFELPWHGALNEHGEPAWELAFSWRDLILIAGGMFLIWKATTEIHHSVDPQDSESSLDKQSPIAMNFGAAIIQILLLDLVFSIDSILTAVGMTDHLPVMIIAVVFAVGVMLALGFLLMIGATLIADGFGVHVPKGYIYAAMAFSGLVEGLNMASRAAAKKRDLAKQTSDKLH